MKTNADWRARSSGTPLDQADTDLSPDANLSSNGGQATGADAARHPFSAQPPFWPMTGATSGAQTGGAAPRSADENDAQPGGLIANGQSAPHPLTPYWATPSTGGAVGGAEGQSSVVPFVYAPTTEQALLIDPASWLNGGGAGVFADWQSLLGGMPHPTLGVGGLSSDILTRAAGANATGTASPLLAAGFANDRFES